MYILSGSSNESLAKEIASLTKAKLIDRNVERFSDGEIKILIKDSVSNQNVTIVQTLSSSNHLLELLFLIEALKAQKVKKISVIIPYLFYSRQDNPKIGEPLSPKVIIKILEASGINEVICLDLHSKKILNLFSIPVKHMGTARLLENIIKPDYVIIAPDAGGVNRARNVAKHFNLPLVSIKKTRLKSGKVSSTLEINGLKDKDCFIIDDIIDSGNTICEAANVLVDKGAKTVQAFCTHALLSNKAIQNIENSKLDHLFITNSIDTSSKISKKISVISIAPLISEYINLKK